MRFCKACLSKALSVTSDIGEHKCVIELHAADFGAYYLRSKDARSTPQILGSGIFLPKDP